VGGGDAETQMSESTTECDRENDAAQEKLIISLIEWLQDDSWDVIVIGGGPSL